MFFSTSHDARSKKEKKKTVSIRTIPTQPTLMIYDGHKNCNIETHHTMEHISK